MSLVLDSSGVGSQWDYEAVPTRQVNNQLRGIGGGSLLDVDPCSYRKATCLILLVKAGIITGDIDENQSDRPNMTRSMICTQGCGTAESPQIHACTMFFLTVARGWDDEGQSSNGGLLPGRCRQVRRVCSDVGGVKSK